MELKIFFSWSGQASQKIATILGKFIPCIIQNTVPFVSSHDLESGGRWRLQLSEELEKTNYGILCLTPENTDSPWIIFEAGALTKQITDSRACGLLFNGLAATDISGPLSQFQHKTFSKENLYSLIVDINKRIASPSTDQQLNIVFESLWPKIEEECNIALIDSDKTKKKNADETNDRIKISLDDLFHKLQHIENLLEKENLSSHTKNRVNILIAKSVKMLSQPQRNLLAELADATKKNLPQTLEGITDTYSANDLQSLINLNLVIKNSRGEFVAHSFVVENNQNLFSNLDRYYQ